MSKPTKTEAELIAMATAELKVHADCPDEMVISISAMAMPAMQRRVADARADGDRRQARLIPNASPCWCRSATTSASSSM